MNNPNLSSHTIIQIYAIIIEPLYKWLHSSDKKILKNEEHEILLIVKGQMSNHINFCKETKCFCKSLAWTKKVSPLFVSDQSLDIEEISECLLLLEWVFKTRVERTILLNIKEESNLVLAYIYFLSNF